MLLPNIWLFTRMQDVITRNSEIMGGEPCFRGTRVPFQTLLDYLEHGQTLDHFLEQFPGVSREMAIAALESAKESLLARIARRFCWMTVFQDESHLSPQKTVPKLRYAVISGEDRRKPVALHDL